MATFLSPIIDRAILFGNPVISGAQISPNGEYISFIKPLDGVMNIWVKKRDDNFADALPVTNDTTRPVRSYFWSRDSQYILYVQDKGGDENFHLYSIDPKLATKGSIPEAKDLSDYENIRAIIYSLPRKKTDTIILGINDRDPAWHDCYEVSIATGERKLLYENLDQISAFYFDKDANLRLCSRSTSDGGAEILEVTQNRLETILRSTLEESVSPLKFKDETSFYVISNVGEPDLSGLYLYNLNTREQNFIESDPENQVDIHNVSFSEITQDMVATIYIGDKKRIYWKDDQLKTDYEYLKSLHPGAEISLTSMTQNESIWIYYVNNDTDPGSAYLYYRDSKKSEHLYTPRPDLPSDHLAPMKPVRYKSIDGLEIPAYLTLPKVEAEELHPAVIFVHGGPWARDYWGYNSFAQFLANRGYATLQVNFRGSTGFGKNFLNAAINQWGEKMQDDLTAGAQYLIDNNIADPNKIAIAGGSYGGYATLAGLTFTPEVYAAGVSIVGPSNLFTLLDTIPPYWESARTMFHKRMGDPNTEEGRAQLKRQSPFFHAKNIRAPLMVAQGDNDPRVKTSESDQIVIAMRDFGLPVTYLNFPDEGHGFANPANNMAFIAAMEKFLSQHLGGRYQDEIPTKLKKIIDKVTVDVNGLEMPVIASQELLDAEMPIPTKPINNGVYLYHLSLDMGGQVVDFELKRQVEIDGDMIKLTDSSASDMNSMTDSAEVVMPKFKALSRQFSQGQMLISYKVENEKIFGTVDISGAQTPISIHSDKPFLIDGPSLDTYLCLLPLEAGYIVALRVFDSINQQFQDYLFSVIHEENILGIKSYRCLLKSITGSEKSQTIWIANSSHPFMVKKSSIMKEMGGAHLNITFKRMGSNDDELDILI